jgi:hypothetical protein
VLLASELSSWKGPVPLASVVRSMSSAAFSGRIAIPLNEPIRSSRCGVGWLSVMTTVCGPSASTEATLANRKELESSSSMIRL